MNSEVIKAKSKEKRFSHYYWSILFVLILTLWTGYLAQRPIYNWDMIAYSGVVLSYSNDSPQDVHRQVYEMVDNEVPSGNRDYLRSGEYRLRCERDSDYYSNELVFYQVKPLYTMLVYGLNQLGVPLLKSTYLVSILSYWLICIFCFFWLKRMNLIAFLLSLLIMFSFPMISLATYSTPDCLSTLCLLLIYEAVLNRRNLILVWGLCALAVLARIDNLIFAMVFLVFSQFRNIHSPWFFRRSHFVFVGLFLVLIGSFFFLPALLGDPADGLHFFDLLAHFKSWIDYSDLLRESFFAIIDSGMMVFVAITVITYKFLLPSHQSLLKIVLIGMILRFILFPAFQERFFIHFEILTYILLFNLVDTKINKSSKDELNALV